MPQRTMYCMNCEKNGIKTEIYFDNMHISQSGKKIPLEKSGGKPHQCPYSQYAMKQKQAEDFIEGRGYMERPQQQQQQTYKITSSTQQSDVWEKVPKGHSGDFLSERIDVIEAQIRRLIEGQDILNKKEDAELAILQKIMEFLQTSVISNKDQEIAILRQKVTELEEVIKKEGMGMKTAKGERIPIELTGEYVKEMVHEGKEDEELEI